MKTEVRAILPSFIQVYLIPWSKAATETKNKNKNEAEEAQSSPCFLLTVGLESITVKQLRYAVSPYPYPHAHTFNCRHTDNYHYVAVHEVIILLVCECNKKMVMLF